MDAPCENAFVGEAKEFAMKVATLQAHPYFSLIKLEFIKERKIPRRYTE